MGSWQKPQACHAKPSADTQSPLALSSGWKGDSACPAKAAWCFCCTFECNTNTSSFHFQCSYAVYKLIHAIAKLAVLFYNASVLLLLHKNLEVGLQREIIFYQATDIGQKQKSHKFFFGVKQEILCFVPNQIFTKKYYLPLFSPSFFLHYENTLFTKILLVSSIQSFIKVNIINNIFKLLLRQLRDFCLHFCILYLLRKNQRQQEMKIFIQLFANSSVPS